MIYFESVKFDNMDNICIESISFTIKDKAITCIKSINKDINNKIFNTIIGLNRENSGSVFIDKCNLFDLKISSSFSIINKSISFVDDNLFKYNKKIKFAINEWIILNNLTKRKLICKKWLNELGIIKFWTKKISELNLNEYISLILFFIKLSNKKHFLIKDFFSVIANKVDAQKFISSLQEESSKNNTSIILFGFDFSALKGINYLDLRLNSKLCSRTKTLTLNDYGSNFCEKKSFFKFSFFKLLLKKNYLLYLVAFILNFAIFTSSFILNSNLQSNNIWSQPYNLYSISILLVSLFLINCIISFFYFTYNQNYFRYMLIRFYFIPLTIIFIIFNITLPIIFAIGFALILIYIWMDIVNSIAVNNNLIISFIFIELAPFIIIPSVLSIYKIKNLLKKEKIFV